MGGAGAVDNSWGALGSRVPGPMSWLASCLPLLSDAAVTPPVLGCCCSLPPSPPGGRQGASRALLAATCRTGAGMNYIFGNSALLPSRAGRSGTPGAGQGPARPKPRFWARKGSAEEDLPGDQEPWRWPPLLASLACLQPFLNCLAVSSSQVMPTRLSFVGSGEQDWRDAWGSGGSLFPGLGFFLFLSLPPSLFLRPSLPPSVWQVWGARLPVEGSEVPPRGLF